MKNNINHLFVSLILILSISLGSGCIVEAQGSAPSGIRNNGTGGIYVDINSSPFTDFAGYTLGENAYGPYGCAWYASARVNQLTGKGSTIFSGKSWYNTQYANYGFSRGQEPKSGSLICFSNHVAVLEKIEGNTAYVSQGGYPSSNPANATYGYCTIDAWNLSAVTSIASGFLGYVYFGGNSVSAQPSSNIWVSTDGADTITETNATVRGSVGYSGSRPTEAGLYFGTSADNMSKVAHDAINFSKNPFNLWYDLNGEANQYLSPGTTYYYKMYAIQNGVEVCGETKSFTSGGSKPAPAPETKPQTPSSGAKVETGDVSTNTGTNAIVHGVVKCSGQGITEMGLYFGESPNNMYKAARTVRDYGGGAVITPYYNLNKDAGINLTPGSTYYYKFYAIQEGVEVCGETKSFVSEKLAPTPKPNNTSSAGTNSSYGSGSRGEVMVTQVGNTVLIFVNGKKVNFTDARPFIDLSDRTVVPVRALTEFLGATVDWNEAAQRVTVYKDGTTIVLTIGSRMIEVNGVESRMDTFAVTMNDRTYLPIRYVAEALGMTVLWE